ncbi:MAG: SDR family oxidoreductase [Gammaproteobacteria bacterium]|nr:SDR family oxidoreductase [Gammaproteobacteria bacterium]NNK97772.1 SDR family oxidoreductase [Xanthomonadales bacterium]
MKVLIAGCGDVGSKLASALLEDGHIVFGLKRDTSTLPEGVQPVQADLTRPETIGNLPEEIDTLVFLPTPASRDQAGYEAIFIDGWQNLWASLRRIPERTLIVSSTAVYGESNGGHVDELTAPDPTGFNGKVLLRMEQQASNCTGNLVIARISGIYGPGRERLIRLAASGGVEIQQTPVFFTNRIHRDDAAAALQHLLYLDHPDTIYVVSDDLPAPRYEVVEWLAKAQGKPAPTGLIDGQGNRGKRVSNRRLRESGFSLTYPDFRAGYGALLGQK